MMTATEALASLLVEYAQARKTRSREQLFAYGAELATIASLMTANVSRAVDAALENLTTHTAHN